MVGVFSFKSWFCFSGDFLCVVFLKGLFVFFGSNWERWGVRTIIVFCWFMYIVSMLGPCERISEWLVFGGSDGNRWFPFFFQQFLKANPSRWGSFGFGMSSGVLVAHLGRQNECMTGRSKVGVTSKEVSN